MVTATAGVNGRMGKNKQSEREVEKEAKMPEGRAGKKAAKAGPAFLDDNPALRNTLAQIEKEFGEGSIMPLGLDAQAPIEGISSKGCTRCSSQ